ncbi:YihY/virulence factor BrkB family protein [Hymenobacter humi]|uniref:YihY/virulence factor BrkB family protein n=1 Tax=Hymenobacter humi TaxID=1411620 RepID=A0ABW2UF35_9BACT
MTQVTAKGLVEVFQQSGAGFARDKVPKMSAALAYYAIFSLGPMLMVIIFTTALLWQQQAVEGSLYGQIKELLGDEVALQVQEIIKNAALHGHNTLNAFIGIATLLVAATGLFAEMQDSINTIWQLRIREDAGWRYLLKTRVTSFLLIISLGFLLIVSLVISGVVEGLMGKLQELFPGPTVILVYAANLLVTLLITTVLFAIIYKVLPDAIIRWKDVAVGALFTAVLFMVGKFGITLYLTRSNVGSAYGVAGSLVVLLLFIYYSTILLYLGAEFTKYYVLKYGIEIRPVKAAVLVQTVQVKSKAASLQANEETRVIAESPTQKQ